MYLFSLSLLILSKLNLSLGVECVIRDFEEVQAIVASCKIIVINNLVVPGGEQLTLDLTYGTVLIFRGTTLFEVFPWKGPLVKISGYGLNVVGEKGSVLDGQGMLHWDGLGQWGAITKPRFMEINAFNSIFDNILVKDCPIGCVQVKHSENVVLTNWRIDNLHGDEDVSPVNRSGHNTDGIGLSNSSYIKIENTSIYNQDDCIVVNSGSSYIIRNIFCHGSHGLSLSVKNATVDDVIFENSLVSMADNGIHVKAHADSGTGWIRNVIYRNIIMLDCKKYGINIQQNYINVPPGQSQESPPSDNIPIYNLTISNIYGKVQQNAVPVYILCAADSCFDWTWEGVEIYGGRNDNCTNLVPLGYRC